MILITDAVSAMGLPPGTYKLGTQTVEITDVAAFIKGQGTLAGR
jgi:N-acetylglucosamine-6-phosphate deacetylase